MEVPSNFLSTAHYLAIFLYQLAILLGIRINGFEFYLYTLLSAERCKKDDNELIVDNIKSKRINYIKVIEDSLMFLYLLLRRNSYTTFISFVLTLPLSSSYESIISAYILFEIYCKFELQIIPLLSITIYSLQFADCFHMMLLCSLLLVLIQIGFKYSVLFTGLLIFHSYFTLMLMYCFGYEYELIPLLLQLIVILSMSMYCYLLYKPDTIPLCDEHTFKSFFISIPITQSIPLLHIYLLNFSNPLYLSQSITKTNNTFKLILGQLISLSIITKYAISSSKPSNTTSRKSNDLLLIDQVIYSILDFVLVN